MPSVAQDKASAIIEVAPPAAEQPAYLEFRNLAKVYATRDGPVRALDQISLSQREGEFLSDPRAERLRQEHAPDDRRRPASGRRAAPVAVQGRRDRQAPRTDIGIVFQSPVLLEWRTALGNIMLQAEAQKARPRRRRAARARAPGTRSASTGFEEKYPRRALRRHAAAGLDLPRADPQSAAAPDGRAVRGARRADARPARARPAAHLERARG